MPFCIPKIKDNYLVVSEWVDKEKVGDLKNVDLELSINGKLIQKGNTSNMLFSVVQAI
jgi:2-keto-4-pentenoate hydratase/2-oxohepta-3-ene-1,7-dioic acid hydratase in catechol pathway